MTPSSKQINRSQLSCVFPFHRTDLQEGDCFYVNPDPCDYEKHWEYYLLKISKRAINLKLQYFSRRGTYTLFSICKSNCGEPKYQLSKVRYYN